MSEINELPQLSPEEIRVLGALIEKSKTTPDYYPLTLNSLLTACNQKSARNPVVEYDEDIVLRAIDNLKRKSLMANVLGDGRSVKYRHTLAVKYPLDPAEVTVMGLLFLRGPLTVGEIKSTAGRMYDFEDLQEVQQVLNNLSGYETPFVKQMERRTGQKESRYCHLFAEPTETIPETDAPTQKNTGELEARLEKLELEIQKIKDALGIND